MKKLRYPITLLILILLLAANTLAVFAQTPEPPETIREDKVILGQTFILREDQVLEGDLAVIGGTAILRSGSRVSGDIALIGGVLRVDGTISGDIQAVGGSVELLENAVVEGSLFNFSSSLRQEEGAVIEGQQVANLPFTFSFDGIPSIEAPSVPDITVRRVGGFIGDFIWGILQILAIGALAMLVMLLAPKPTERIATSIGKEPFVHWGIGLLSAFAIPAVLIIMMITILLIPLGLIGFLLFAVMVTYGWLALGYEIGKRILKSNTQTLSPALVAGIGTLILTTISRIAALVPCVGWTVGAALALFGLGAIVLTRFGTRNYPPTSGVAVPATPVRPASPPAGAIREPSLDDIIMDDEDDDYEEINDEEETLPEDLEPSSDEEPGEQAGK